MAAVFDIAEIKHRAAASGSRFSFAVQDERARNAKLSEVLEAVEATLVSRQENVERVDKQHELAVKELQRLSDVLHDRRVGPPRLLWRLRHPESFADRAELIGRLDAIIAVMSQEGGKGEDRKRPIRRGAAPRRMSARKPVALATLTGLLAGLALAAIEFNSAATNPTLGDASVPSQSGDGAELAAAGEPGRPAHIAGPPKVAMLDGAAGADLDPPRRGLDGNGASAGDGVKEQDRGETAAGQGLASTQPQPAAQPEPAARHGTKQGPAFPEPEPAATESVVDPSEADQATRPLPALQAVLQKIPTVRPNAVAAPAAELAFAPMLTYSPDKEVRLLLAHAKSQLAGLALTTPKGDNAYETYQLALSIQPDNQAAFAGIEQIGLKYVELAKLAAAKGDFAKADLYASKAKELAPDHALVRALAEPAEAVTPMSDGTAPAGAREIGLTASPPAKTDGPEAKIDAEAFIGLPPSAADESQVEGYAELISTLRPAPSQDESASLDLDTEILQMSPLVVPIYPGQKFFRPITHNERNRSHDRDVASTNAGGFGGAASNGTGSGGGGSGDGGSGGGGSGGGGSGDGGSGGGGSGDGGSGDGGSGDGGSGDGGSGGGGSGGGGSGDGGNGNGDGGNGNGNGNGGGNGNGNGGNNGNAGGNGNGNGNGRK